MSLEWVLGIRPVFDPAGEACLLIDPVPPTELGQVEATRTWRGKKITVRFDCRAFIARGRAVVRVIRDGQGTELPGGLLRARDIKGRESVELEVSWTANPPEASDSIKKGTARGQRALSGVGEPKLTSGRKSRTTTTAKRK